jgi:hypothetical protein
MNIKVLGKMAETMGTTIAQMLKVRENPSFLATDEYIDLQLNKNWLMNLAFQMGPNCNGSCYHCYGNYGPNRKGLPSKTLADKVIGDMDEALMLDVILADGEAFRPENKDVVGAFAKISDRFPLSFITNSRFAGTQENAFKWFNFLKENGWATDRTEEHKLTISTGDMYDVPWVNYANLLFAFRHVYGDDFVQKAVVFENYITTDPKKDSPIQQGITNAIFSAFQEMGEPQVTFYNDRGAFSVEFKEGTFGFAVFNNKFQPQGRGLRCKSYMDVNYPFKQWEVKDLGFTPDNLGSLVVASSGDVSFGNSLACFRGGRKFGNVLQESLLSIKKKIYADPIYQAFRLGGVRFLSYLSSQVDSSFIPQGRMHCDVCYSIFEDVPRLNKIKDRLSNNVAESYKQYLSDVGLPRIMEVGN